MFGAITPELPRASFLLNRKLIPTPDIVGLKRLVIAYMFTTLSWVRAVKGGHRSSLTVFINEPLDQLGD